MWMTLSLCGDGHISCRPHFAFYIPSLIGRVTIVVHFLITVFLLAWNSLGMEFSLNYRMRLGCVDGMGQYWSEIDPFPTKTNRSKGLFVSGCYSYRLGFPLVT